MISLPALLIIIGLVLWLFTIYNAIGIVLLVVGLILAVAFYPTGGYGRRVR